MAVAKFSSIALEAFLEMLETKPASEYINGEVVQKPAPKTRHSRLQGKLIGIVNQATEEPKIAYAFPELRCTFGDHSIVPDVAVLHWERIEFDPEGEPMGVAGRRYETKSESLEVLFKILRNHTAIQQRRELLCILNDCILNDRQLNTKQAALP